ncbi:trehalase family glycosidase [Enterobacter hormaechei]
MIERYGHIPNGNRTYYLSRSPSRPFALMVELFEEDGVRGAKRYLEHLKMEYAFWMAGGIAAAQSGLSQCGSYAGWLIAQPLLGRSRYAAG